MAAPAFDPQTRPNGDGGGISGDRRRTILALICIAAVSAVGSIIFLSQSPHGVHASPDSFTYLSAADNLAHGRGWTYSFGEAGEPVTLFPPLYPLLLAVPELLDLSTFGWVTWQNAFLLGVLSFVVGITVFGATGGGLISALLAAVLVALGTPTITAYAHVWSEPLFYPLVVVVLASLGVFFTGGRTRWLVIGAAATSAAMLTRYAGLSLFVTACLLLLGWPGSPMRHRLGRTALFATIALPLSALWLIRNQTTSGTLTGNNQLVHSLSGEEVLDGLRTVGAWFVPEELDGGARVLTMLLLVALSLVLLAVAWAVIRSERLSHIELPAIFVACLTYGVVHFLFIVLANAFSTRSPPFNDRILGPAFAPAVIAVLVSGHAVSRAFSQRVAYTSFLVLGSGLLALSVAAATQTMPVFYSTERGTLPSYQRLSRSLEDVIEPSDLLLSNRANIAWFITGRSAASLPRSCRGGQILPNPDYDEELQDLATDLGDDPRQVIFFRRSPKCAPFSMKKLKDALQLEETGPRGLVFVLEGPPGHG